MKQGLVQVYTGDGKGKTTAAAGLAMRAAGRGLSVTLIQFLKCDSSGEIMFIEKRIPEIRLMRYNSQKKFIWNMNEQERELMKQETLDGMKAASSISSGGGCDILILDEIFGALKNGFISTDDILELINKKSPEVELVLTGRDAPESVVNAADLVTEMRNIRHPFDSDIIARDGIER